MEKHLRHTKRVNLEGSYYMRNHRFEIKRQLQQNLEIILVVKAPTW